MLHRKVASIYIPDVNTSDLNFERMFQSHCQQKLLFDDLIKGNVNHEEILEALEAYIGTSHMDDYIANTEEQLDELENNVLWFTG